MARLGPLNCNGRFGGRTPDAGLSITSVFRRLMIRPNVPATSASQLVMSCKYNSLYAAREQSSTKMKTLTSALSSGFQAHQIKEATIVSVTDDSCLTLFEPAMGPMGPATVQFNTTRAIMPSRMDPMMLIMFGGHHI